MTTKERQAYRARFMEWTRAERIAKGLCFRCGLWGVERFRNCIDCRIHVAAQMRRLKVKWKQQRREAA